MSAFRDDPEWNNIWGNNVRFAVLVDNEASTFEANYAGTSINKVEELQWVTFPWEEWWKG
jgi:hypothetical protein